MLEQHYCPHGLTVKGGANTPLPNKYLHQGKELRKEHNLDLYDFHARQYDPQIGRFWGIDPADQYPSGYTGMGNDPANMIDPTGMLAGGARGPGASDNRGGGANWLDYDEFSNTTWGGSWYYGPLSYAHDPGSGGSGGSGGGGDGGAQGAGTPTQQAQAIGLSLTALAGSGARTIGAEIGISIAGVSSISTFGAIGLTLGGVLLPENWNSPRTLGEDEIRSWHVGRERTQLRSEYELLAKTLPGVINLLQNADKGSSVVYRLFATRAGEYPVMQYGSRNPVSATHLNAGDTWKWGTTSKQNIIGSSRFNSRYSQEKIPPGIDGREVFRGNASQSKLIEHVLIMNYYFQNGTLPPGNKVPW